VDRLDSGVAAGAAFAAEERAGGGVVGVGGHHAVAELDGGGLAAGVALKRMPKNCAFRPVTRPRAPLPRSAISIESGPTDGFNWFTLLFF
jgi:hypothetical protein